MSTRYEKSGTFGPACLQHAIQQTPNADAMLPVTDAHAHFWSPSLFEYRWISEDSPFAHDFLPDAYREATLGIAVERMIFVECDCHPRHSVAEADWVLASPTCTR